MPTNAPESAGSEHGEAAATHTPKPRKNTGVQEQTSKKESEVPLKQLVRIVPGPPPQEEQVVCMCACIAASLSVFVLRVSYESCQ
jgi:hypothetical protein